MDLKLLCHLQEKNGRLYQLNYNCKCNIFVILKVYPDDKASQSGYIRNEDSFYYKILTKEDNMGDVQKAQAQNTRLSPTAWQGS